jgi:hypothetical protein
VEPLELFECTCEGGREGRLRIQVEMAARSPGGLDWWVKERQQWLRRVRGTDGRQRWVRAVDLRPANRPVMPS